MLNRSILVAVAVALGGPVGCVTLSTPGQGPGPARTPGEYCDRLIEMYGRYLAGDELGQRRGAAAGSNIEGRFAVAKCQQGDPATGIPILERLLVANGFKLPR